MDTVLPIALIKINIFWLPIAGFFIGFATGMFGVGGGIIAVPAMLSLGIAPFIAVANSISQAIGTTFSGALTQYKKGNLNLKIASYLIVSGLLGGYLGVKLVGFLEKSGDFDKFFDYVFYSFLLYTGISLVLANFKKAHLKQKRTLNSKHFSKNFLTKLSIKKQTIQFQLSSSVCLVFLQEFFPQLLALEVESLLFQFFPSFSQKISI